VASFWEIVTKVQIGKLPLPDSPSRYLPRHVAALGAKVLAIEAAHVMRLETLPFHHRDPFDRLIICQAMVEQIPIVSVDSEFDAYGVTRIW